MKARNALRNGLLAASLATLPLAGASLTANAESSSRSGNLQEVQLDKGEKEHHGKHHKKHGERHGKKGGPLGQLTYFEVQNLAVQSVATLADQPVEAVRETAKEEGMRDLLKDYDISREALAGEMAPKMVALVKSAESKGRLTALQSKALVQQIETLATNVGEEDRKARARPMRELAKMQSENLTVDVLAELSGKNQAETRQIVNELGPRLSLQTLGVERDAFEAAMETRMKALVEASLAEGSITADQADRLAERIEKGKSDKRG